MFRTLKRLVYQVPDLGAARQWYNGILRTEPVYDTSLGVIYRMGDCTPSLAPGGPHMPPDNGQISAYWEVDDVDAAVQTLLDSGATLHTEASFLTLRDGALAEKSLTRFGFIQARTAG